MNLNNADKIDLDAFDPKPGEFKVVCLGCGSSDVEVDDGRAMGSSQTGAYGSLDFRCRKCGAVKLIADA
jgi:hypothetical protein